MFRCSQFYDVSFNRFSIRSHLFSGKQSHPGQLRCSEMGVAGSDVRPRPRPSPDMVTACCIARKGNFRTGPALNGKMDFLQLPDAFDSSDEDRSLRIPTAAKAKRRVRWRRISTSPSCRRSAWPTWHASAPFTMRVLGRQRHGNGRHGARAKRERWTRPKQRRSMKG